MDVRFELWVLHSQKVRNSHKGDELKSTTKRTWWWKDKINIAKTDVMVKITASVSHWVWLWKWRTYQIKGKQEINDVQKRKKDRRREKRRRGKSDVRRKKVSGWGEVKAQPEKACLRRRVLMTITPCRPMTGQRRIEQHMHFTAVFSTAFQLFSSGSN